MKSRGLPLPEMGLRDVPIEAPAHLRSGDPDPVGTIPQSSSIEVARLGSTALHRPGGVNTAVAGGAPAYKLVGFAESVS